MPRLPEWTVPAGAQPKPEDYDYDLDRALGAVVGIRSIVPADAFSAETLGTERAGNGVLIREGGVVLTIGYLITEAEQIWLTFSDGRVAPGHVLGFDQETGFGLVQALARVDLEPIPIGQSGALQVGERVVVGGAGGRASFRRGARRRSAGICRLLGIRARRGDLHCAGASQLGRHRVDRRARRSPGHRLAATRAAARAGYRASQHDRADRPVQTDLRRPADARPRNQPPRPWLGLYADRGRRPRRGGRHVEPRAGAKADLRTGDVVLAVGGNEVSDLAGLFRRIWSLGDAGVDVPLTIYRDGKTFEMRVPSADRRRFLKAPRLH